MNRDKAMEIIKNHGLYCKPLCDSGIELTDKSGVTYDIITIMADGNINDGLEVMSLKDWLGY